MVLCALGPLSWPTDPSGSDASRRRRPRAAAPAGKAKKEASRQRRRASQQPASKPSGSVRSWLVTKDPRLPARAAELNRARHADGYRVRGRSRSDCRERPAFAGACLCAPGCYGAIPPVEPAATGCSRPLPPLHGCTATGTACRCICSGPRRLRVADGCRARGAHSTPP